MGMLPELIQPKVEFVEQLMVKPGKYPDDRTVQNQRSTE